MFCGDLAISVITQCPFLCRLDARDENRGHKVLGYMVYCDGALKAQVEGALTSQVEIHMLEGEKEYDIRVW